MSVGFQVFQISSDSDMKFQDYLALFQLARSRNFSPKHYFDFQQFQGALLVNYLFKHGIDVNMAVIAVHYQSVAPM